MRSIAPRSKDKRYFRRTWNNTKSVNLGQFIMRGGIRF